MALIGMMQNKGYIKEVEEKVHTDTGQARESNFELISSRAEFKAQQASNEADIARSNTFKQVDGPLQALLTGTTNLAREFPVLTTGITGAVAAIGIWKAASIGAGLPSLLRGKPAAATAAAAVSAAPAFNPFGSLGGTPVPSKAAPTGFLGRAGGLLARQAGSVLLAMLPMTWGQPSWTATRPQRKNQRYRSYRASLVAGPGRRPVRWVPLFPSSAPASVLRSVAWLVVASDGGERRSWATASPITPLCSLQPPQTL